MPRAEYTNMSHARLRLRKLGNHIERQLVTLHLREQVIYLQNYKKKPSRFID